MGDILAPSGRAGRRLCGPSLGSWPAPIGSARREGLVSSQHRVLLYGGTGRTGGRVLTQLLERGVDVRAIVRDPARLPDSVGEHPRLTVVEDDLLSLSADELRAHLAGCDTVISCLGHTLSARGILGPPRDLVTRAVRRTCVAIDLMQPASAVRLILMNRSRSTCPTAPTASATAASRRYEPSCARSPPAKDNQDAADYLAERVGPTSPTIEWVVVRPDTLTDGDVTAYRTSRRSPRACSAQTTPGWPTWRTSCAS